MPWLLRWTTPVILGGIDDAAIDRFWSGHAADAVACISAPVEVSLLVSPSCTVQAVQGPACLSDALVGAQIPASYCGCGVARVTQTLSRQRR